MRHDRRSDNQLHVHLEEFTPATDSLSSQQDQQKGRMSQAEKIHLLEGYHERFE